MIIFNLVALGIVAVGFIIATAACAVLGFEGEGPLMIIAGLLVAAMDLGYRFTTREGHWFAPSRGGSIFWLPVWGFGALWFLIGIVNTVSANR